MEQYILICVYVLSGLLGLCVGSFLNVVIYRVPLGMNLSKPASHCPSCNYKLRWYDNVPVFSWLVLRGRCRSCKQPISVRYTAVELLNCLLWVLSVALFWKESVVYALIAAAVSSLLVCVFFIDLEHLLIFNRFSIMIAACGLVAMFFDSYTKPLDHVIGALAGGGVFALIYFGARLILKREALGFGDVKLAAAAGLLLGWQKLVLAILIASVVGSIVLVILNRAKGQDKNTEYPFGPFIVGGVLIALMAGAPILEWYTGLILG